MTKLDDVYMLALKTILNFETVSEIREQGYSRIPVYDTDRSNIVHVLFAKDLMFIDPDDNMPLSMVCEFYQNDVTNVFDVSFWLFFCFPRMNYLLEKEKSIRKTEIDQKN